VSGVAHQANGSQNRRPGWVEWNTAADHEFSLIFAFVIFNRMVFVQMGAKLDLDRTDFGILSLLMSDATLSNKQIAAEVGLAPFNRVTQHEIPITEADLGHVSQEPSKPPIQPKGRQRGRL
jgi:hypothetical protein